MAMTAFPDDAAAAGRRQARMMRVVNAAAIGHGFRIVRWHLDAA